MSQEEVKKAQILDLLKENKISQQEGSSAEAGHHHPSSTPFSQALPGFWPEWTDQQEAWQSFESADK